MNKNGVLVTGASTGIGFATSVELAKSNYRVFAGVRSEKDGKSLEAASPNITPVILDVTKSDQIDECYKLISCHEFETFSLVNNAGIVVFGPVETLPLGDFRNQFEVNFFGLIEVTQKFLPLMRKNPGRIVNISSISGIESTPFLGAYSASKFALEALSDSLRWELLSSGIKVIIVQPGPIATPIWEKGMAAEKDLHRIVPETHLPYYSIAIARILKMVKKEAKAAIPVKRVTDAVVRALTKNNPPNRITVASSASKIQLNVIKYLPTKMLDRAVLKMLYK